LCIPSPGLEKFLPHRQHSTCASTEPVFNLLTHKFFHPENVSQFCGYNARSAPQSVCGILLPLLWLTML
jgi:hypothetical protein